MLDSKYREGTYGGTLLATDIAAVVAIEEEASLSVDGWVVEFCVLRFAFCVGDLVMHRCGLIAAT